MRAWLSRRRSAVVTATSGTLIAALIATVAVVSGGYSAQRVDLNDGAVWVTNGNERAIGRANTAVLELNSVIPAQGTDIDVVQGGESVLLFDRGNSKVDIVDPATSTIDASVPVPPSNPDIFVEQGRVVVASPETGEVWIRDADAFDDFDVESEPTLSLGAGTVASVDADGLLFAFSPDSGELYRVPTATGDSVDSVENVPLEAGEAPRQVTSVAGRPAVYDPEARALVFDGRRIDLSGLIPADVPAVVQEPALSGTDLLIAHPGGVVGVPLGGSAPRALLEGAYGPPAAPVSVAGCDYSAWGDGTAWRRCDGDAVGTASQLVDSPTDPRLEYRVNNNRVVLNDALGGMSWAVQRGNDVIDNWDALIDRDQSQQVVEEQSVDTPAAFVEVQQPPVAVDDEFGVRAGRANPLPVLLNDYDPNGDVLLISEVTPLDESVGRLDLINDRRQVQITVAPDASGRFSFDYTITDGRGGTATATVTVLVRSPEENSPPQQVRSTTGVVQSGARLTTEVLGDWYDPDGDAFYLTRAAVAEPDQVSWQPDGTVVFTDQGAGGESKPIALSVSDGIAEGAGVLTVSVRTAGSVPIVTEPFAELANAGSEITIQPLRHVRGGSGTVRLTNVAVPAGTRITPDYDGGTFRFVSSEARTHLLEYTVSDGTSTATGVVRVEVSAPLDPNTRPITATHTVFLRQLSTQNVDVLATDVDPAGGVLLVTEAFDVPVESGLQVQIFDQRLLRVTATQPLEGPVSFSYRVSNGLADAVGTVTVIEIPHAGITQPPVAMPDSVSVRVGDAIDIPVLANDTQPDGDPLTLAPDLPTPLPAGSGLLFASSNVLRYLAPDKTGNFTAEYRVEAPDGQWATARVSIAVREVDADSNNPPVPKTVTARVLAGERVRIPIPLTGIDPDGDSVQLLGQETSPTKGAVLEVGADWIEYEAGSYSAGADTFAYAVTDSVGARAVGTVRIGIGTRPDGARNPIAIADEVTVRPGRTVLVQVLANDSDPDGSPLSVTGVAPTEPGVAATVEGDVVRVVAPTEPGRYGFVYDIENDRGGTSSTFLTVVVADDAPLARPVAKDTVLSLSDVVGRRTVDVNVLDNVFFADGPVRSLGLGLQPGYDGSAQVVAGKRIRVTLGSERQIIPFRVSHPDDSGVTAYAFVWVPGFAEALPQLNRNAPRLTVQSGATLTIPINDHVVAVSDRNVRLTDANSVRATRSNGGELVVDAQTLRFTSEDRYFGPASISFEVTDGATADDPRGNRATLVLPITVTPRANQPPSFNGAVLELEPGEERQVDLLKLTTYPYSEDRDDLRYSVIGAAPTGFSATVSGSTLTLSVQEAAVGGTAGTVTIGVRDALNEGVAGRIELRVVPSTRPLAQPQLDVAIAPRNTTTVVDVLQNDAATNPFPGKPLRVVAVRGIDSASLPAGVSVSPSDDRSHLTIAVAGTVPPGDVSVQYQVLDATGDPARAAWGTVRISIQDRPDPVVGLRTTGFGDRRISVAFDPGAFNNSPIQGYEVRAVRDGTVVSSRTCESTTCDVTTDGNGPSSRVRIEVLARNAIGLSDPVALTGLWSDVVPPAPTGLTAEPLDRGLRVIWNAVDTGRGSAVTNYVVSVGGVTQEVPAGRTSIEFRNVVESNGGSVGYSVSARNGAQVTSADAWNTSSSTGTPLGAPRAIGAPAATPAHDAAGTVSLTWQPFSGDGRDGIRYWVAAYSGAETPSCTVSTEGVVPWNATVSGAVPAQSSSGHTFSGLAANAEHRFAVIAANSQGCTLVTDIAAVTPRVAPTNAQATVAIAPGGDLTGVGGRSRPVLSDVTYSSGGGTPTTEFFYRIAGTTTGAPVARGDGLTLAPFGEPVSIEVQVVETHGDGTRLESAWSPAVSAGVAVDTTAPGMRFIPTVSEVPDLSGTFEWLGSPTGSGYTGVEYSIDGGVTWIAMAGPGASDVTGGPEAPAAVTVRVLANGLSYTQQYRGNER